jgi:hypothetical protein
MPALPTHFAAGLRALKSAAEIPANANQSPGNQSANASGSRPWTRASDAGGAAKSSRLPPFSFYQCNEILPTPEAALC